VVRFGDFFLRKQLQLLLENRVLVIDITEFSWMDAAESQLEIIEFHENVAVKKICCDYTPKNLWSKEGISKIFQYSHFSSASSHYVWVTLLL